MAKAALFLSVYLAARILQVVLGKYVMKIRCGICLQGKGSAAYADSDLNIGPFWDGVPKTLR